MNKTIASPEADVNAWAEMAEALSDAWCDVTVRHDIVNVYRGNKTPHKRDCTLDEMRQAVRLHYERGNVCGLYVSRWDDDQRAVSTWIAFDIDAKPDKRGNYPTDDYVLQNLEYASRIQQELKQNGIDSIVEQSGPYGSYHVWAFFDGPVSSSNLWAIGRYLAEKHKPKGRSSSCESFPKSPQLTGKGVGGMVRLPGRYKIEPWWSRIVDESGSFLDGVGSSRFLFDALTCPNTAGTVDDDARLVRLAVSRFKPVEVIGEDFDPDDEIDWLAAIDKEDRVYQCELAIRRYYDEGYWMPPTEGNRHVSLMKPAFLISVGFALYDSSLAFDVLQRWDERYCDGSNFADGANQISDALSSAIRQRRHEFGYALKPDSAVPTIEDSIVLKVCGELTLDEVREKCRRDIVRLLKYPEYFEGLWLSDAPPSAGKTEAFIDAIRQTKYSPCRIYTTTHAQCEAILDRFKAADPDAEVSKPPRQVVVGTPASKSAPVTCINPKAALYQIAGYGDALCYGGDGGCEDFEHCCENPDLFMCQKKQYEAAPVQIGTTSSLALRGFGTKKIHEMPDGKRKMITPTVVIDEDPAFALEPHFDYSLEQLSVLLDGANEFYNELVQFGGEATCGTTFEVMKALCGNLRRLVDATAGAIPQKEFDLCILDLSRGTGHQSVMWRVIYNMVDQMKKHSARAGLDPFSFRSLLDMVIRPDIRFRWAVATGNDVRLCYKNDPIEGQTVLITDATNTAERLSESGCHKVQALSDRAIPEVKHPVYQWLTDAGKTKERGISKIVHAIERVVLNANTIDFGRQVERIGLISNSAVTKAVDELMCSRLRRRLVMVDHFGGTRTRGSNDWVQADLLVVAGTHREPLTATQMHAAQVNADFASYDLPMYESRTWRPVNWTSDKLTKFYCPDLTTRIGREHVLRSRNELEQCLHRARPFLANIGIPVILLSSFPTNIPAFEKLEELPSVDKTWGRPNAGKRAGVFSVLDAIDSEGGWLTTADICELTGVKVRLARKILDFLKTSDLIERARSPAGGWQYR